MPEQAIADLNAAVRARNQSHHEAVEHLKTLTARKDSGAVRSDPAGDVLLAAGMVVVVVAGGLCLMSVICSVTAGAVVLTKGDPVRAA